MADEPRSPRAPVGSDIFTKGVLSIITALIGFGVLALYNMNSSVTRLETRVEQWGAIFKSTTERLEATVDRVSRYEVQQAIVIERLRRLESKNGTPSPPP